MKQRLEVSNIYFCGMRCIENKTDLMKEWWCGSQYEQLNDVAKIVLNSLHSRFMGHINYEGSQFCCSPFIEYNADINFFFFFFWTKIFILFVDHQTKNTWPSKRIYGEIASLRTILEILVGVSSSKHKSHIILAASLARQCAA
jgi:hypothetical protein